MSCRGDPDSGIEPEVFCTPGLENFFQTVFGKSRGNVAAKLDAYVINGACGKLFMFDLV
jgi:hypothetical protein